MSVNQLVMEEFERLCCIQDYHVYQEIWTAAVGEELVCERARQFSLSLHCSREKDGDHHRSFATKAIETVFAVLKTRWVYLLYGIGGKKILT